MSSPHPEYTEYTTCTPCGLKKMCRLDGGRYICYSCDHGNFNGLRNISTNNGDTENGNEH